MIVYSNDLYDVKVNPSNIGYIIVNRKYEVVEGHCDKLPSAITSADMNMDVLIKIYNEKGLSF